MFQVFTIVPSYNDRDGISGWSAHVHPYAFVTEAGALAVATLKGRDDEVEMVVVPAGASPFDRKARVRRPLVASFDDIPF